MKPYLVKLTNLSDTSYFAKRVAESIVPNFVVTLIGDLGAGKTTLIRQVLYELGVVGSVKSPTYTLVEPYVVHDLNIFHFDLYRFSDPEEWFDSGFDEYFVHNSICFVEWADKAVGCIPVIDWQFAIKVIDDMRYIEVRATSDKGSKCLQKLIKHDVV